MKRYEQYSVEDFVQDDDFRDWVQGQSPRENFWLSFPQKFPSQAEPMRRAEQIIRAMNVPDETLSEKEIRTEVEDFLIQAGGFGFPPFATSDTPLPAKVSVFNRILNSRWAVVAAVLVAVTGIAWYVWPALHHPRTGSVLVEAPHSGLVVTTNPTRQPLRLYLSDGTQVLLSPNSSLSYPSQFSDTARTVFLMGEASFSVTHRGQPFLVHSGEMITKVLGTRFVVSAFSKDKKYTVQVLSGKVSVFHTESGREAGSKEVSGLILTANQAAIFEKDRQHLTKTLVANPAVVSAITVDEESRYDEVPLPVILHGLERAYGITIQFDEQSLKECKITATLTNESLYEKLDLLCKTISASYEIVDGQIVLNGKACH